MKTRRVLMGVLALTVVVSTILACTKDELNQGVQHNVDSNETSFMDLNGIHVRVQHDTIFNLGRDGTGWLDFESKSDYELAIASYSAESDSLMSSFETALSFSSMRSVLTREQREAIDVEDDLLAMLLSPSGIIQVGNYIFDIDVANDTVLVYNQLFPSENPLVFSVDDEIFDVLEGNKESGEKGCSAKNKMKGEDIGFESITCKVVYQKAGIYFSLQSKIKKDHWGGPVDLYLSCYGGNANRYRKNKENITYFIPAYSASGGDHSYNYRPYSGIRKLVNFHFIVYFRACDTSNNHDTDWFNLSIHCGV